jgi:carbon storage regulator CsrA
MLVLTRKKEEKIVIIDNQDPTKVIELVVLRMNGTNQVRLGIQAPKDIFIQPRAKKAIAANGSRSP